MSAQCVRLLLGVFLPEKASLLGLERLAFWGQFEPEKASLFGSERLAFWG